MKILASSLVLSILIFILVTPAFSRDIFVDNVRGNDEFTGWETRIGVSGTGPVKTITRALKVAQAGDRIVLTNNEGEPYQESVTFLGNNHSAANARPFTLEGNGALLDGSEEIDPALWQYFRDGIFRFQPKFMAYQNLFLDGRPLERAELPKDEIPVVKLNAMQWCMHEGYVYFKPERERMPDEYALRCAGRKCGITLIHVQGVEIRNLTVQGFQNDGIAAANAARQVYLNNVTLRGNARAGLSVGGACTVWVINSMLGNNNYAQLLTENYSRTHLMKTDLISNTAPGWVDRGGEVNLDGKIITGGLDQREAFKMEAEKTAAESEKAPGKNATAVKDDTAADTGLSDSKTGMTEAGDDFPPTPEVETDTFMTDDGDALPGDDAADSLDMNADDDDTMFDF